MTAVAGEVEFHTRMLQKISNLGVDGFSPPTKFCSGLSLFFYFVFLFSFGNVLKQRLSSWSFRRHRQDKRPNSLTKTCWLTFQNSILSHEEPYWPRSQTSKKNISSPQRLRKLFPLKPNTHFLLTAGCLSVLWTVYLSKGKKTTSGEQYLL